MNETGGNPRYRSLRILGLVLCLTPVLIGVVLYFVLGSAEDGMADPPLWVVVFLLAMGLVILAVSRSVGYRTAPAEDGEPEVVGNASVVAFQSAMIMRFGICESLMIVAIALAFVLEPQTFLTYLVGGLLSLALMLYEVLPGERSIARTQASLESRGRPSYLREALGLAGRSL